MADRVSESEDEQSGHEESEHEELAAHMQRISRLRTESLALEEIRRSTVQRRALLWDNMALRIQIAWWRVVALVLMIAVKVMVSLSLLGEGVPRLKSTLLPFSDERPWE